MLDSHQLNVFLVAAETLNFTQAAQRLHMSQPSVSQHIQSLERHFDAQLFLRVGRNLHLTSTGLALVPLAREMVKQSIRIDEMMASLHGEVHGHLLVGCSTTPGKYVLPQLLANFHRKYPKVKMTCQVTSQGQALQLLCDGEIHFALTSMILEPCREVELIKYMSEKIILIAPPDHPWALRGQIDPHEIYEVDFIMREEDSGTYQAVSKALSTVGIQAHELKTLLTLGNSEAIALSVREGLGVGFVSNIVVERLGEDRTVPIQLGDLEIRRDIYIGRNVRRAATKAQAAFWDFMISTALVDSEQGSYQTPIVVPVMET